MEIIRMYVQKNLALKNWNKNGTVLCIFVKVYPFSPHFKTLEKLQTI
jgi:hypothetical protein